VRWESRANSERMVPKEHSLQGAPAHDLVDRGIRPTS
jgi:hypothetical protein